MEFWLIPVLFFLVAVFIFTVNVICIKCCCQDGKGSKPRVNRNRDGSTDTGFHQSASDLAFVTSHHIDDKGVAYYSGGGNDSGGATCDSGGGNDSGGGTCDSGGGFDSGGGCDSGGGGGDSGGGTCD